ncbi:hypothetical protein [Salinibacterium sp. M195]|uniref:hypothetical protein n=1 Tax=Salinibacterium sp. M195 TaxID=2583374 RepID=UPI001C62CFE1|nr:hypothetical protein [Salinibacterium sp. M195]QYH36340.1 ATP-binding protein [Salinibacterium sp. M195]
MIIWLNGPFGVGKTATVVELLTLRPEAVVFDTEAIGFMLRDALGHALPAGDFQELRPWRRLTIAALGEIADFLERDVIVPQSVLVERHWDEIQSGLVNSRLDCVAVTLHAEKRELERRIDSDTIQSSARQWRLDHREHYKMALPWLRAKTAVIDTTNRTPETVARLVTEIADSRR